MLKTSIVLEDLEDTAGLYATADMLREAGFEAVDAALFTPELVEIIDSGAWQSVAESVRNIVSDAGLTVYQCHTTLPAEPSDWPRVIAQDERQLAFAGAIGAQYAVVHPICPITVDDPLFRESYEVAMERNLQMYRRLLPAAEKAGVTICTENLFADGEHLEGVPSYSSHAAELNQLMDQLPGLKICLDIGHAAITGQDPAEMVRAFGDRLAALHLHGNDHVHDLHLPPFERPGMGWEQFCGALKDVGYQGTVNLETMYTVP